MTFDLIQLARHLEAEALGGRNLFVPGETCLRIENYDPVLREHCGLDKEAVPAEIATQ